ncbi:unnamed protein product [Oncorhynchus mykiss]|uniref:Dehydrogenase/reductase SDR family member 11 n=1 Tax=Oncorhynchus mykiss TaxID=8022 RepID=A0A060Z8P6_ONCMY|nr:unnamed protein product [Oncorhynchus mykiss]
MFSAIKTLHQGVDVCINNAGLAHNEPLLSGKTDSWRNMIDVNVLALSICTREAYQSMKERNVDDGHIININSMGGHRMVPSADEHFYCATKYAVTALTEGCGKSYGKQRPTSEPRLAEQHYLVTVFHMNLTNGLYNY